MKIYPEEKSIAHLLKNNSTAGLVIPVKVKDEDENTLQNIKSSIKNVKNTKILQALANLQASEHPDLMYGSAILVSTVMNKNDDVFLPDHTWSARHTPINTPYNEEHQSEEIIGHIVASRALNEYGEVIEECDEAPEYFDIEADFVIYKSIFPEIAMAIAENAPKNKQFVSMECRFNDFDYAVFDTDDSARIIARNERTAFLSKYLRSYGGNGVYNNKRIGRVLKNIRFTGMGNVKVPANPASEYTRINYSSAVASYLEEESFIFQTKGNTMVIENIEKAKELIDTLNKDLDTAKSTLSKTEEDKAAALAEKVQLDEKLTAESAKLKLVSEELEKANKSIADLKAEFDKVSESLTAKEKELKEIHDTRKREARANSLKEIGLEMTDEEASKMFELNDETFASLLITLKNIKDKSTASKTKTEEEVKAEAVENAQASVDADDITNTAGNEPSVEDEVKKTEAIAQKIVASIRKVKQRKSILN